jgi:TRAP-type C4-dicarboxylate transport system permease small subunit
MNKIAMLGATKRTVLLGKIGRILDRLIVKMSNVGAAIGVVVIIIMIFLVTLSVLLRYIFMIGLPFTTEYSEYLLLILVYMGLAYTTIKEKHITVDFVVKRLSKKVRSGLEIATTFLAMTMVVIYFWYVWRFWIKNVESGATAPSKTVTPLWIPQIFMWVGLGIFTLAIAASVAHKLINFMKKPKEETSE